jgi:hypothetical protein
MIKIPSNRKEVEKISVITMALLLKIAWFLNKGAKHMQNKDTKQIINPKTVLYISRHLITSF